MGCSQSKVNVVNDTFNDVVMQIGTRHSVKVACATKKNYYPKNPDKPNQDAFCKTSFTALDGSKVDFFGVFDGHGEHGHKVAQYVAKNLPDFTQKEFKRMDLSSGPMDIQAVEKACLDAHLKCNESLKEAYDEKERNDNGTRKQLDCSLSGTTSITMVVWNGGMTICNVGDSRAIMGEVIDTPVKKQITARALSHDQIPIRKDERDRVKACGCRVLTLNQAYGNEEINEEENEKKWTAAYEQEKNYNNAANHNEDADAERIYFEDPPRLFSPKGLYPGYQFTRSFGDFIGTDIGIIAKPEISTTPLKPSTRMIILASDGVFEYLTDQDVIDVCALFPSPKDACAAVSELAYKNWIDKDVRTDDITMVCIYSNIHESLEMSQSIKGSKRGPEMQEAAPIIRCDKSGLPDFTNLTAECVLDYIKAGELSNRDFSNGPSKLKSSESMEFDPQKAAAAAAAANTSPTKLQSSESITHDGKVEQEEAPKQETAPPSPTKPKLKSSESMEYEEKELPKKEQAPTSPKLKSSESMYLNKEAAKDAFVAGGDNLSEEGLNSSLHYGMSAESIRKLESSNGVDKISEQGLNSSLHCGLSPQDIKKLEQQTQQIGTKPGGGGVVVCSE